MVDSVQLHAPAALPPAKKKQFVSARWRTEWARETKLLENRKLLALLGIEQRFVVSAVHSVAVTLILHDLLQV
jgi:hypothetical protein